VPSRTGRTVQISVVVLELGVVKVVCTGCYSGSTVVCMHFPSNDMLCAYYLEW
jgi:hypothetical protein